jgi:hypothetical protein
MNAQATLSEPEPCPVCFNDDVSSLKRLNGCGHSICGDCKYEMYHRYNQFKYSGELSTKDFNFIQPLQAVDMKLLKCPICRTIEKPSHKLALENAKIQLEKNVPGLVLVFDLSNPNPNPNPIQRARRTRALSTNPLLPCQRTGCRRKCRTRDRCPNHPDVGCCWAHLGCNQCH